MFYKSSKLTNKTNGLLLMRHKNQLVNKLRAKSQRQFTN